MKIGDIVIMKEEGLPRNEWRLGKVINAFEDGDGLVHKATIQLGDRKVGQKNSLLHNPSIVECPIHKLVLLVENS